MSGMPTTTGTAYCIERAVPHASGAVQHPVERLDQIVADTLQLVAVQIHQSREDTLTCPRETYLDDAPVNAPCRAANEVKPLRTVHQLNRAIVRELERIRQLTHRRPLAARHSFDSEQQLVMLRRQSFRPGRDLAEA